MKVEIDSHVTGNISVSLNWQIYLFQRKTGMSLFCRTADSCFLCISYQICHFDHNFAILTAFSYFSVAHKKILNIDATFLWIHKFPVFLFFLINLHNQEKKIMLMCATNEVSHGSMMQAGGTEKFMPRREFGSHSLNL